MTFRPLSSRSYEKRSKRCLHQSHQIFLLRIYPLFSSYSLYSLSFISFLSLFSFLILFPFSLYSLYPLLILLFFILSFLLFSFSRCLDVKCRRPDLNFGAHEEATRPRVLSVVQSERREPHLDRGQTSALRTACCH